MAVRDNRVRALRLARGFAQARLAVEADISVSTLISIEKYAFWPTERVRGKLAAALGVEVGDIWPEGGGYVTPASEMTSSAGVVSIQPSSRVSRDAG